MLEIQGHPTWFTDRGDAPGIPVLLLHGGSSNSDVMLDSIGDAIAAANRLIAFDRRGHGRTADTDAPFHYDDMATETIALLEAVVGGPAHLVGWSDGGIVALFVALRRPDLVARLVLIGTNYHYEGTRPLELSADSPFARSIFEAYSERAPDGVDHFDVVMDKASTLVTTEPTLTTNELSVITAPTLVIVGDDDLIEPAHTQSLYQALPAGRLAIVPGASHALPMEQPEVLGRLIVDFLDAPERPDTLMPITRAHPAD